jgi:hypothetical protein
MNPDKRDDYVEIVLLEDIYCLLRRHPRPSDRLRALESNDGLRLGREIARHRSFDGRSKKSSIDSSIRLVKPLLAKAIKDNAGPALAATTRDEGGNGGTSDTSELRYGLGNRTGNAGILNEHGDSHPGDSVRDRGAEFESIGQHRLSISENAMFRAQQDD